MRKKVFIVIILSATDKKAGSGSGSVSQWYESADPDLYQNVTDPQHCFLEDIKCKRSLDIIRYVRLVWSTNVVCIAFQDTRILIVN
jgi:hypothetical protein